MQILRNTQTPLFLCEAENLVNRYTRLANCLKQQWGPFIIGYSFKTNYAAAQCGVLRDCGAWAEVVSGREYQIALDSQYAPASIIFNGPLKSDQELRSAFRDQAIVNANDHDELGRIIEIASTCDRPVAIGIRISTDLPRLGPSRFGFSIENEEAVTAVRRIAAAANLNLVGVHIHLYGDTDDPEIYGTAAQRVGAFARENIPSASLEFIDMGGGISG